MNNEINIGVVEDDPLVGRDLQKILTRLGYQVPFVATTALDAIARIEQLRPDLLLVDIKLPQDMDGVDLVQRVQNNDDIPIIYLTAYTNQKLTERIKSTTPYGYLLKPVRERELHAMLEIALSKHQLEQKLKETNRRLEKEIIERKQAEEALRHSEERYRTISEVAANIAFVYQVDREGNFKRIWGTEEAVTQITGYNYREIDLRGGWLSLIHSDDRPQVQQHENILRSGQQHAVEYRITTRSGDLRWINDVARPLWDETQSRATYIYGACRDITQHKYLEEQLRHSQKMEALGQLAGGVAHHFNNMLTAIMGYTELSVMELPEDHPAALDLQHVQTVAQQAAGMTRKLLAFTRKQVIRLELTDLNELVLNVKAMLGRLISSLIEFETILFDEPIKIRADPGQFEQVLVNLILNSRDAMPDGGRLSLQTDRVWLDNNEPPLYDELSPGYYALLTVTDTGIGMNPQTKAHIFEPFFTTKSVGQGLGLGLSTCFGIIKQHNGHIIIESEPNQGTAVKVYLPCYND